MSEQVSTKTLDVTGRCKSEAESLIESGQYNCAEAVLAVIRKHLSPSMPEWVLRCAHGFGGGSGVGCICGALSGATIAFGLVVEEDDECIARLTEAIHLWFKQTFGSSCCRVLRNKGAATCVEITGDTAAKTFELLIHNGIAYRLTEI